MNFRTSSLPLFAAKGRPKELEAGTVLAEGGALPDTPVGWRRNVGYLGVLAEEEAKLREKKFGRLSRGWCVGSNAFKAGLRKDLAALGAARERFALLGADAEAHREVRAGLWEECLQRAAETFGVNLTLLPPQQSVLDKVRLAAVMKATTSVSNGWLAQRLNMGAPAHVSQYVRRLRMGGGTATRRFCRALSQVNP